MRVPAYLSPSALGLYGKNEDEYYLKYCAENRPPRIQQTKPMSVGGAFDCFVKAHLADVCGLKDYDFDDLFQNAVEKHNRDFALEAGNHCFEEYKKYGMLARLVALVSDATVAPRMEFDVYSEDNGDGTFDPIPPVDWNEPVGNKLRVRGKPDLFFELSCARVLLDWKVNGYCSQASPIKNHVCLLPGATAHRDAHVLKECGIEYDAAHYFEETKSDFADQLATYGWQLGEPVGTDMIVVVHQLAWRKGKCRVAQIAGRISKGYQKGLYESYKLLWSRNTLGNWDSNRLEAIGRIHSDSSSEGEFFSEITRGKT